jgi:signal transduction histidine kinase
MCFLFNWVILQESSAKNSLIPTMLTVGGILVGLFALSFLILFVIARQRQNSMHLLQAAREQEFSKQLLQVQIEIQEQTFVTLAQELHDNIGQLLGSAKMLIGITERNINPVPETLIAASESVGNAIAELRSLSKSLNKEWLSHFSLVENMQLEADRINSSGKIHVTILKEDELLPLQSDKQLMLFRIVQEALTNSVRHSMGKNILIQIRNNESDLTLTVADDGVGFDQGSAKLSGVGMIHLQQRVAILGGTVQVTSQRNHGTTIMIAIPNIKPQL